MPNVLLLSFDPASIGPRTRLLETAGFSLQICEPSWPACLEMTQAFLPDVIAVDLGKLPSHGRSVAKALREHRETRDIPLVLFRVASHELETTRLQVPGGVVAFDYELVDRLRSAALTRLAHRVREERRQEEAASASEEVPAGKEPKPRKARPSA